MVCLKAFPSARPAAAAIRPAGRLSRHSQRHFSHSDADRRGLTLLEVLISVSIFFASLTAIVQILNLGRNSEMMTRLQTEAVMRCESKMAEVISGAQELTSVSDELLENDGETGTWNWSLESAGTETANLLQITVTVRYVNENDEEIVSFSLTRYMRDPQLFLDAASSGSTE